MTNETEIIAQAFRVILFGSAPALLVAALVGAVVGLVQSVIQVQDQTISYVLKLGAVCLVLAATSSWLMLKLTDLFESIFEVVPTTVAFVSWVN
jgi:type III secretion protein S